MNVTSLELGDDESIINAEGDMGSMDASTSRFVSPMTKEEEAALYTDQDGAVGNDIARNSGWEVIDEL